MSKGRRAPVPFTSEELRKISSEISDRKLPEPSSTRLELMDVDPWNVHAYWHINAADIAACRSRLSENAQNAKLVLRFADISPKQEANALPMAFDIEVGENCNNWYVNLWRDAKHYSSEIGLRAPDGTFEALVRSNEVTTPRASPSPDLDFILVEACTPDFPEQTSTLGVAGVHNDLLRNLFPLRLPLQDKFPLVTQDNDHFSSDEPPFPSLNESREKLTSINQHGSSTAISWEPGEVLAREQDDSGFPMLPVSELNEYGMLARTSRKNILVDDVLPSLPPIPSEMIASADIALVSHPLPVLGSLSQPEDTPTRPAENPTELAEKAGIHLAPGEYSVASGLGDDLEKQFIPSPIALEMLLGQTVFSYLAADNSMGIAATLNIQGACPPDRRLSCFGEPINIGPDGTFSIKLPLECGPELVELLYRARSRLGKE